MDMSAMRWKAKRHPFGLLDPRFVANSPPSIPPIAPTKDMKPNARPLLSAGVKSASSDCRLHHANAAGQSQHGMTA